MEKPKFHLNPNEEIVKTIREGLKRTGGYWSTRTTTGRAIAGCM